MDFITYIFICLKKNGYFYDYIVNKEIKLTLEVIEYLKEDINKNKVLYAKYCNDKGYNVLFDKINIILLDFNLL